MALAQTREAIAGWSGTQSMDPQNTTVASMLADENTEARERVMLAELRTKYGDDS